MTDQLNNKILVCIALLFLAFPCCCCHSFHTNFLAYESISFDRLSTCKTVSDDVFSRAVYWDEDNQQFIKLWHSHYPLAFHFLRAVKMGYYEGLTFIKAVIFDQSGNCRGYTMERCQEATLADSSLCLVLEKNEYGYNRLKDIFFQNSTFQLFYENLLEASQRTGLFYLDLAPSNLAIWQDQYVLLDLEGVYLKGELVQFNAIRPPYFQFVLESLPPAYSKLIRKTLGLNERTHSCLPLSKR